MSPLGLGRSSLSEPACSRMVIRANQGETETRKKINQSAQSHSLLFSYAGAV